MASLAEEMKVNYAELLEGMEPEWAISHEGSPIRLVLMKDRKTGDKLMTMGVLVETDGSVCENFVMLQMDDRGGEPEEGAESLLSFVSDVGPLMFNCGGAPVHFPDDFVLDHIAREAMGRWTRDPQGGFVVDSPFGMPLEIRVFQAPSTYLWQIAAYSEIGDPPGPRERELVFVLAGSWDSLGKTMIFALTMAWMLSRPGFNGMSDEQVVAAMDKAVTARRLEAAAVAMNN